MSLLGRAVAEDQQAWTQLVQLYGPLVQRWCKQAGLNEDDTADIFQETFQTVSKGLAVFKPKREVASFRSWLKTIVRTKTIDHHRKANRQAAAAGGAQPDRLGQLVSGSLIEAEADRLFQHIQNCQACQGRVDGHWQKSDSVIAAARASKQTITNDELLNKLIRQAEKLPPSDGHKSNHDTRDNRRSVTQTVSAADFVDGLRRSGLMGEDEVE